MLNCNKNHIEQKINSIEYIVHPTYLNYDLPLETMNLLERISDYSWIYGKDKSKLFILNLGTDEEFKEFDQDLLYSELSGNVKRYNEVVSERKSLGDFLKKELIKNCSNLFIGETTKFSIASYGTNEGVEFECFLDNHFRDYLDKNNILLDVEDLILIGHGTVKGACVEEELKNLENAIKQKYNINSRYTFNDDTCVELFSVENI